jgi:16S rRNA (cytidine1402-2'-O)-methyltransferase
MARLHLLPVPIASEPAAAAAAAVLPAAAIELARHADYFLAENARSARAFLKSIGHPRPIAQLQIIEIGHEPDVTAIDQWLAPLQVGDPARDGVVLSEAGCPGIADPGSTIVARAHELGVEVVPWVGPCSLVLALMASGMNGQEFRFHGYLPRARAELIERLRTLARDALQGQTQIFIETPYRNGQLLAAIVETCDAMVQLCVAIDLTGSATRVISLPIAQWRTRSAAGEITGLQRQPAVFLLNAAATNAVRRHR